MKRVAFIFACCLLALAARAEIIDRVVATVNGRPILQSDVDETARYEAFIEGKPLASITPTDVRGALDRLIDQELLRQQMGEMAPKLTDDEIRSRTQELQKQHATSPEQWRQRLATYGLDENTFSARLENQLRTLGFLDQRLRPSVLIDRAAVETYYRDTLLPQLHKSGVSNDPAMNDVQRDIREILTQQSMDHMLTTWLQNLRQQSRVHILLDTPQTATGGPSAAK